MVEPVKYTEKDVVAVKPGDVIPKNSVVFRERDGKKWSYYSACGDIASYMDRAYAPMPFADLPPEPKEVPFGEAMERIKNNETLLATKGDWSKPVSKTSEYELHFLLKCSFSEMPLSPKPKTTGLNLIEACRLINGTSKGITRDDISWSLEMHNSELVFAGRDGRYWITFSDLRDNWRVID